jgi:hypothetical protein
MKTMVILSKKFKKMLRDFSLTDFVKGIAEFESIEHIGDDLYLLYYKGGSVGVMGAGFFMGAFHDTPVAEVIKNNFN